MNKPQLKTTTLPLHPPHRPRFTGLVGLGVFLCALLGFSAPAQAMSSLKCFGVGAAEAFFPGVGYLYTEQYGKAAALGGGNWYFMNSAFKAFQDQDTNDSYDQTYQWVEKKDSTLNKNEFYYNYNQGDWQEEFSFGMSLNFTFISIADMYRGGCEHNPETAQLALAPVRFDHFLSNWMFYPPVLYWAWKHNDIQKNTHTEINLGRGLKASRVFNEGVVLDYTTGIAEEMLLRGTIQQSLFNWFSTEELMSPEAARHSSIFLTAAALGGGSSGSRATEVFLLDLYQGYTYHPKLDEQDLMTTIAIHSWTNMLVSYWMIKQAKVTETNQKLEVPLLQLSFNY